MILRASRRLHAPNPILDDSAFRAAFHLWASFLFDSILHTIGSLAGGHHRLLRPPPPLRPLPAATTTGRCVGFSRTAATTATTAHGFGFMDIRCRSRVAFAMRRRGLSIMLSAFDRQSPPSSIRPIWIVGLSIPDTPTIDAALLAKVNHAIICPLPCYHPLNRGR